MIHHLLRTALILLALTAAVNAAQFQSQWTTTHDRIWVGEQYWANPMEDWRIHNGRLECTRAGANRNVHVLTRQLGKTAKSFEIRVKLGRADAGRTGGSAGFRIGIKGEIDDYRHAALFGKGLDIGITADGRNGVLEIRIPKRPAATPRRIQVGGGQDDGGTTVQ